MYWGQASSITHRIDRTFNYAGLDTSFNDEAFK